MTFQNTKTSPDNLKLLWPLLQQVKFRHPVSTNTCINTPCPDLSSHTHTIWYKSTGSAEAQPQLCSTAGLHFKKGFIGTKQHGAPQENSVSVHSTRHDSCCTCVSINPLTLNKLSLGKVSLMLFLQVFLCMICCFWYFPPSVFSKNGEFQIKYARQKIELLLLNLSQNMRN